MDSYIVTAMVREAGADSTMFRWVPIIAADQENALYLARVILENEGCFIITLSVGNSRNVFPSEYRHPQHVNRR